MIEYISIALAGAGTVFFVAGTLGVLRFPDVYTRLHALSKADNLGLGLIVLSLAVQADSIALLLKLVLIWFFVIVAGATSCYLVARAALQMNIAPMKTKENEQGGGGE